MKRNHLFNLMYKTRGEPFNLGYRWYSFLLYTFLTLLCFFPLLFGATDARRRRHCLCTRFRARNGTAAKNLCLPGLFMHRAYLTCYTNADSCIRFCNFCFFHKLHERSSMPKNLLQWILPTPVYAEQGAAGRRRRKKWSNAFKDFVHASPYNAIKEEMASSI